MQLPTNDKTSLAPCLVQMCLGVKQEGKSRTWVCGALPCVTQRGEKNPHRATDSFLLNLSISPVSDDASFSSKTDSIPSDLYSGITHHLHSCVTFPGAPSQLWKAPFLPKSSGSVPCCLPSCVVCPCWSCTPDILFLFPLKRRTSLLP